MPPLDPALAAPVRFSHLRHIHGGTHRSPAHYRASILEPREPSAVMRFGRIVHAVLLGGTPYVIYHGARQGKRWEAFEKEHAGALILTKDEYLRALWCCDAIGRDADAPGLLVGAREVERSWTTLGRRCVGHLDVQGRDFVTEFKSASSTHPETFRRACLRMGYHAQVAWYLDGIGMPNGRGFIVGVETGPPYAVTCFELTRRCLDDGRKLYRIWMELLLNCEAVNEWPGYAQSILPLDVEDYSETLLIDGEEVEAA